MSERPPSSISSELSADAMREKAIKSAKRILAPHVDAALILLTWRDDELDTQNEAATVGNEHATDNMAKVYYENGCTFGSPEGEDWQGDDKRKRRGKPPDNGDEPA